MILARWRQAKPGRGRALCLVTCLVIFGLLNIPGECGVATGAHSLFLSAASVAELQHAAAPDKPVTRSLPLGRAPHTLHLLPQAGEEGGLAPANMADMAGTQDAPSDDAPPTPPDFAGNVVPLRLTNGPQQGPRLGGVSLPISTHVSELSGQLHSGPEPPPPNLT